MQCPINTLLIRFSEKARQRATGARPQSPTKFPHFLADPGKLARRRFEKDADHVRGGTKPARHETAAPEGLLSKPFCLMVTKRFSSLLARRGRPLILAFFVAAGAFPAVAGTAPSITSGNATIFPQGVIGYFTVTTSGIPTPSIVESGHLPGGVKFVDNGDGTGTLLGRPGNGLGQVGDYNITFTATNGVNPPAVQNFKLTVSRPPRITSVNNATFVVGTARVFNITTTNTVPKATLSFTGTLPAGVTFVANNNGTASLSGTPAAGTQGIYPLVITGANGMLPNATQKFKLVVASVAPTTQAPAITSPAGASFREGVEGTFTVRTTGTPTCSLSTSGTLPAWLSFVDNTDGTATLVGAPDSGTAGTYSFTITATNGITPSASQTFTLTVIAPPPQFLSVNNTTFVAGTSNSFSVRTAASVPPATITFTGSLPSGVTVVANSNGTATLSGTPANGTTGSYPLVFTAANGTLPNAVQNFTLTVASAPPATQAPLITSDSTVTFSAGVAGNFSVTTTGMPTPHFTLLGPLPSWLTFKDNNNGTASFSGTPDLNSDPSYPFTILAANGVSPSAMQNFVLQVALPNNGGNNPIHLANISTRLKALTGDSTAIAGFIISGQNSRKVLIRGLGPTLTKFGVPNALADTTLQLFNSDSSLITSNDDWKSSQQADIAATGLEPSDDHEAAILISLAPGAYTVFASGANNTTGIVLVEVYDVDQTSSDSHLSNISTRGTVLTNDAVMIGGFVLAGADSSNVVIRALGPTLTTFGVPNALADPTLTLVDANGTIIVQNDNWKDSQQTQLENTGLQPLSDLDAAIFATLPAANYTAIVAGKGGTTGVALVEIYLVQ